MLIADDDTNNNVPVTKSAEAKREAQYNSDAAGPSTVAPPPTFDESVNHVLVDLDNEGTDAVFPQGGEEPPPSFTPYKAEYFVAKDGNVISHDPHLNQDGKSIIHRSLAPIIACEALYRFLLSQSESSPPTYHLHCKGSHPETRTRLNTVTDAQGRRREEIEHYTETVTDFDFLIDAGRCILPGPFQWTVGDDVPAYRGKMVKEVGLPGPRPGTGSLARPKRKEVKAAKKWEAERSDAGLPPWVRAVRDDAVRAVDEDEENAVLLQRQGPTREVFKSSWTLRQWADDYCASPKHLKEFVYEKVVYGWNQTALISAVRSAILSTHYRGDLTIRFLVYHNQITIRPDTRLSRFFSLSSNPWLKLLFIITLIYPFLLLYRRFHPHGGGRWKVGGGAYATKRWVQSNEGGSRGKGGGTSEGRLDVLGTREGEWFQAWEGTIRRAVATRKVDGVPMWAPDDQLLAALGSLDGYIGAVGR